MALAWQSRGHFPAFPGTSPHSWGSRGAGGCPGDTSDIPTLPGFPLPSSPDPTILVLPCTPNFFGWNSPQLGSESLGKLLWMDLAPSTLPAPTLPLPPTLTDNNFNPPNSINPTGETHPPVGKNQARWGEKIFKKAESKVTVMR